MKKLSGILCQSLTIAMMAIILFQSGASAHNRMVQPNPFPVYVTIPEAWKSMIARQDYENESIFSFKTGNEKSVFLFSVTKVTDEQWFTLKSQLTDATVIANENGYIIFVQKTAQQKIKGASNDQYQQVLLELDNMIKSIKIG